MENIEEETAKRIEEEISTKVTESLKVNKLKLELQERIKEDQKRPMDIVEIRLHKEKKKCQGKMIRKVEFHLEKVNIRIGN